MSKSSPGHIPRSTWLWGPRNSHLHPQKIWLIIFRKSSCSAFSLSLWIPNPQQPKKKGAAPPILSAGHISIASPGDQDPWGGLLLPPGVWSRDGHPCLHLPSMSWIMLLAPPSKKVSGKKRKPYLSAFLFLQSSCAEGLTASLHSVWKAFGTPCWYKNRSVHGGWWGQKELNTRCCWKPFLLVCVSLCVPVSVSLMMCGDRCVCVFLDHTCYLEVPITLEQGDQKDTPEKDFWEDRNSRMCTLHLSPPLLTCVPKPPKVKVEKEPVQRKRVVRKEAPVENEEFVENPEPKVDLPDEIPVPPVAANPQENVDARVDVNEEVMVVDGWAKYSMDGLMESDEDTVPAPQDCPFSLSLPTHPQHHKLAIKTPKKTYEKS